MGVPSRVAGGLRRPLEGSGGRGGGRALCGRPLVVALLCLAVPAGVAAQPPPACPEGARLVDSFWLQGCVRDGPDVSGIPDAPNVPNGPDAPDAPVRDGPWTIRHRDGLVEHVTYAQGARHGPYRQVEHGHVKAAGRYVNDARDGLWTFYDSDLRPVTEGRFDGGRRVGPWRVHECGTRVPPDTLEADVAEVLARFVEGTPRSCDPATELRVLDEAAWEALARIAGSPVWRPRIRAEAALLAAPSRDARVRAAALALLEHPGHQVRSPAQSALVRAGRPEDALALLRRHPGVNDLRLGLDVGALGDERVLALVEQRRARVGSDRERWAWEPAVSGVLLATAEDPIAELIARGVPLTGFWIEPYLLARPDRRALAALAAQRPRDERLVLALQAKLWPSARRLRPRYLRRLVQLARDGRRPRDPTRTPYRELLALGPEAVPQLAEWMVNGSGLTAAELPGYRTPPEPWQVWRAEATVRVNLAWVLGEIGDAAALPELEKVLESKARVPIWGSRGTLHWDGATSLADEARGAMTRIRDRMAGGASASRLVVRVERLPRGAPAPLVYLVGDASGVREVRRLHRGVAVFDALDPGSYRVVIRDQRFAVVDRPVKAPGAVGVSLGSPHVSGRALAEDGSPIPGVPVELSRWGVMRSPVAARVRTGADGRFDIPLYEPGAWTLELHQPGRPVPVKAQCRAGERDVILRGAPSVTLEGRVRDEAGCPVVAELEFIRDVLPTDEAGRFRVTGVAADRAEDLLVGVPRIRVGGTWVDVGLTVRPEGRPPELVVPAVPPPPVLRGRLVDVRGQPVTDSAMLFLVHDDKSRQQFADPAGRDGAFLLPVRAWPVTQASLGARGFLGVKVPLPPAGADRVVDLGRIVLHRRPVLRGRVLTPGGRPAKEASLRHREDGDPTEMQLQLDDRGRFEITLGPGTYRIEAAAPGYRDSAQVTVTLEPEGVVSRTLRLRRARGGP